jgi:MerR family transcriptional regulator, redox-sensitive transcriptional activator SoxR
VPQLTISEAANMTGLQSSAIRYYERIGLLPPAQRISGQRRYDRTVLYRLAVIRRARQIGFTLDEIRQLFFGFRSGTAASERWERLSFRKLVELETLAEGIRTMQGLLKKMKQNCRCETLDQCGEEIFRIGYSEKPAKSLPANLQHRS